MAELTLLEVAPSRKFNELEYIERNGEVLFTAEAIGHGLGYAEPVAESVNRLYRRNENELCGYSVPVKLTGTDGKCYISRAFSEEGVYLISMLSRTPAAVAFRRKVAMLLKSLRQERLDAQLKEAQSTAYAKGVTQGKRIATRADSVDALVRAVGYLKKGLTITEAARLCDMHKDTLRYRLQRLGLYQTGSKQASLLGA